MASVLLTKRIEFSASHRYHNEAWDATRNRAVFGSCNNEPGHGHNYLLEVTIAGEVDAHTGMVVNLYDLKQVLKQVLEEFDHKHLNYDMPYFRHTVPTTENIAALLWKILATHSEIGTLHTIRLFEDEDLFAEITEATGLTQASLTRRYEFAAAHRLSSDRLSEADNRRLFGKCSKPSGHGHNYELSVRVRGEINRDTGMVTDIQELDRLVHQVVIERFDHQDLNRDPAFAMRMATGENLVRFIWDLLVKTIPAGRLELVRLAETRDTAFEYAG